MGRVKTHHPPRPCGESPSRPLSAQLRVVAAYRPRNGLTDSTGKSEPSAYGAPALREAERGEGWERASVSCSGSCASPPQRPATGGLDPGGKQGRTRAVTATHTRP